MPHHDAPHWRMDRKALEAVEEVAPAQRVFLGQLFRTLEGEGVPWNDRMSFGMEVLAAQVNLIAELTAERRKDSSRELGHSEAVNIIVSDIMNRAVLRDLRGDDR